MKHVCSVPYLQSAIADAFNRMYYDAGVWNLSQTRWFNVPVFQTPTDMWMAQQVIVDTKPSLIIETGSALGGSALFFASVFEGEVISIDLQEEMKPVVAHPRIKFVKGKSTDEKIVALVRKAAEKQRVMVMLDSDHHYENVLAEMNAYASLVSSDCYLIVCDTNLGGHPIFREGGEDPLRAVAEFLPAHPEFEIDKSCEKFFLTHFPNGWLRRKIA